MCAVQAADADGGVDAELSWEKYIGMVQAQLILPLSFPEAVLESKNLYKIGVTVHHILVTNQVSSYLILQLISGQRKFMRQCTWKVVVLEPLIFSFDQTINVVLYCCMT